MPLFSRLLNLHRGVTRTEDFFTEIIAYLFEQDGSLAPGWFAASGLFCAHETYVTHGVQTQRTYEALETHEADSRLDLCLDLHPASECGGVPIRVLMESKVGAGEGQDQLSRYADQLAADDWKGRRLLVYVTRDYDPKTDMVAYCEVRGVTFHQLRWSGFHRYLASILQQQPEHPRRHLLFETLHFMETLRMDQSYRFTPLDALVLSGAGHTLSFMDEALNRIQKDFEILLNGKNDNNTRSNQLRKDNRYVIYRSYNKNFEVLLGFQGQENGEYPSLLLNIGGSMRHPSAKVMVEVLTEVGQREGWRVGDDRASRGWFCAYRWKSMSDLLSAQDHLTEVERVFRDYLTELKGLLERYPMLPWGEVKQGVEEVSENV